MDPAAFFAEIRRGDLLVHLPYQSFDTSILRLLESAAVDPHVLAIKLTIYRTSSQSPIVQALVEAARRGKQVAVLVEITARFDEAPNIAWAQLLEQAGAHVAYGVERSEDPCQAGAGRARGARPASAATPTSAPATTTPARRASTRTSAF